jgi:TrmH family RNA methyltransferase
LDSNFELEHLYSTQNDFEDIDIKKVFDTELDLKKISALATPNTCLAVLKPLRRKENNVSGLIVALDSIRDPGNLGTILRLCDWFGVTEIVCSKRLWIYTIQKWFRLPWVPSRVNVSYVDLNFYLVLICLFWHFMEE